MQFSFNPILVCIHYQYVAAIESLYFEGQYNDSLSTIQG